MFVVLKFSFDGESKAKTKKKDSDHIRFNLNFETGEITEPTGDEPEFKLYDEQAEWIKKNCGKKAANMANYGWGVSGDGYDVSISTKVYGHGILTSQFKKKKPIHEFEPF